MRETEIILYDKYNNPVVFKINWDGLQDVTIPDGKDASDFMINNVEIDNDSCPIIENIIREVEGGK